MKRFLDNWKEPECTSQGRGCFLGDSDGKESACNARDLGLIPRSRSSPGEGNGNPLQYSCLENPMDRGAWWAIVHGVTKSQIWLKWLSMHTVCFLQLSLFDSPFYLWGVSMWVKVKVLVIQSCPALCDSMDCSRQAPLSMGFSRQEYLSE